MGRAEQRKLERKQRIANRKGKIALSRQEIAEMKHDAAFARTKYDAEALMTVFGLVEHRVHGFGQKRIFRTFEAIDEMMQKIIDGELTLDQCKQELEEECGVVVKSE